MGSGKILQWDSPANLLEFPATAQVARFTGHNSILIGKTLANGHIETVLGIVSASNELQNTVENTKVEVLLRCCDAKTTAEPNQHSAKVIYRSYEAEQLIYALRLENNEQIFALAGDQQNFKLVIQPKSSYLI